MNERLRNIVLASALLTNGCGDSRGSTWNAQIRLAPGTTAKCGLVNSHQEKFGRGRTNEEHEVRIVPVSGGYDVEFPKDSPPTEVRCDIYCDKTFKGTRSVAISPGDTAHIDLCRDR